MNSLQKHAELAEHPRQRLQERRGALLCDDPVLLEECFRLRYGYFVQERGWVPEDIAVPGLERDGYDEHCLHLGVWDDHGVAAYLRVLPFEPLVGFMLDRELSCVLSHEEREALPREGAVELSRLVVRPDVASGRDDGGVHPVEEVFKALYRASKERGFSRFYVVVEQGWLRPFAHRFGVPFRVLGTPHVFPDGTKTVAGVATLEEFEAGVRRHSQTKYAWYQEGG